MNCNLLLMYMSHVGEGGWQRLRQHFRDAAVSSGEEPEAGSRALRYALEEIGFADFFVARDRHGGNAGSDTWRVLPPRVACFDNETKGLLCGARDPALYRRLEDAAPRLGCGFDHVQLKISRSLSFTIPRISGDAHALRSLAAELEVRFLASAPDAWLDGVVPISEQLQRASGTAKMSGWELHAYDLLARRPVEIANWDEAPTDEGSLLQQSRQWMPRRRAVRSDGRWIELGYREAPYAAAMLRGFTMVEYDAARLCLRVPAAFPLPLAYARAALICSGNPPGLEGNFRVYESVGPRVAAIFGLLLGQRDLAGASVRGRDLGAHTP